MPIKKLDSGGRYDAHRALSVGDAGLRHRQSPAPVREGVPQAGEGTRRGNAGEAQAIQPLFRS